MAEELQPIRSFEESSAITDKGNGVFAAEIDGAWTILGKPNGGYLLAIMAKCAQGISTHEHVIAASSHYLRPPSSGEVTVLTEVLRAGRSASQVRASMIQEGKNCVEALFTVSDLSESAKPFWESDSAVPVVAPFEDCIPLKIGKNANPGVSLLHQIDIRIDPSTAGFTRGESSGVGELKGWLQLPKDKAFNPASLLFAVDAFPPATFDIQPTGWVPTLELTAYVRALPEPGPVRILQRANVIDAGRVDEACFVWDSTGRVVAQGTQLAAIRIPADI